MLVQDIKRNKKVKQVYYLFKAVSGFFRFRPILLIKKYIWFVRQFNLLKGATKNERFNKIKWFPCLFDNLTYTPLEPTYFFQDSWAANKIFSLRPSHHYDVGSSAKTMGILSQFVPLTMVDIRPINLELPNLNFKKGSILNLPFGDESIESLSSLCVVEHIGLGRYGDPIDSFGSEKAIKELKRVLKIGGVVLFSVPVDRENKIYFNAHRAFTRDYVLELFDGFVVLEEKYHYGLKLYENYDKNKGFGTGLYMLKKQNVS